MKRVEKMYFGWMMGEKKKMCACVKICKIVCLFLPTVLHFNY